MAIHALAALTYLPFPPLDSPSKVIRVIITSKEQQLFPSSTSYSPVAKQQHQQQQEVQSEAQSLGITQVTYM